MNSQVNSQVLVWLVVALFMVMPVASTIAQWEGREDLLADVEKTFGDPPGMVRLDPTSRAWADKEHHRLVMDGYIALRNGQLEMLACIVGTKEHESVVAVFSKAFVVHAGLLAIGVPQGKPVSWDPKYTPPTGGEVQVFALWKDPDGKKQSIDVRKWVREIGTKDRTLETNFVFAGSMMWKDPDTGEERYMAESGDLICVSNFTTATLDVPMKSSQVNSGLMFATFTNRIPPEGTPIRLVLQFVEPEKTADTRNDSANEGPNPVSTAVSGNLEIVPESNKENQSQEAPSSADPLESLFPKGNEN
ncbi:MAG: hypothetical protein KDB03_02765 [Planctomycetales bacterium]|nr:hypothetical protein [Planctomycetales bacterium]